MLSIYAKKHTRHIKTPLFSKQIVKHNKKLTSTVKFTEMQKVSENQLVLMPLGCPLKLIDFRTFRASFWTYKVKIKDQKINADKGL